RHCVRPQKVKAECDGTLIRLLRLQSCRIGTLRTSLKLRQTMQMRLREENPKNRKQDERHCSRHHSILTVQKSFLRHQTLRIASHAGYASLQGRRKATRLSLATNSNCRKHEPDYEPAHAK